MKPFSKTWATLNEQSLQKAAAAWNWLNYYVGKRGEGRGEGLPVLQKIGDGSLSKFAPDGVILKHCPTGTVLASLGNRTWGALGLPLQMITDEAISCYKFMPSVEIEFFFVWKIDEWVVVPHEAHRCAANGIVLKIVGVEQPLAKYTIQTKSKSLKTDRDLHQLQTNLGLAEAASETPKVDLMMLSLARYFSCDVDDCMNKFLDTSPEPNFLHCDPLAEEVYRDMDQADQKEFED